MAKISLEVHGALFGAKFLRKKGFKAAIELFHG